MNNITIMGRLTADPKCETTNNGNKVLHFTVAVSRPKVKDTTDFIRCVAWRTAAEFIEKWFCKGKMIGLSGILTSHSWTDDEGRNRSMMEVVVDTVEFCGDNQKAAEHDSSTAAEHKSEKAAEQPDGFMHIPDGIDEELPFN